MSKSLPTFQDSLWVRGWPSCLSAIQRLCLTFYFFVSPFDHFIVSWHVCLSYGETWKWKKPGNKLYWIRSQTDLVFEHRIQQKKVAIMAKIWFRLYMRFCIPFLNQIETTLNVGMVTTEQVIVKRSCSSQCSKLRFSELICLLQIRIYKDLN